MKNILVTLNAGMGIWLGPNFLVYSDVGTITYNATLTELLIGIERTFEDTAATILIESLGDCINTLPLIIDLSCTTTTSTTIEPTTTTTSTSTSSTTTTTTTLCIEVNYSVNTIEPATTTTTSTSSTTTTTTIAPTTTTSTTSACNDCYGLLYNWYSTQGVGGNSLANTGWHVPSVSEFETLREYLDPLSTWNANIAGGKLLETGTCHWDSPNEYATNETGFGARGAGEKNYQGVDFSALKYAVYYWTTDTPYVWAGTYVSLSSWQEHMYSTYTYRTSGRSIRLLKDSTTLSDGQTGTYTGNDGKVYPTICIGSQEWIAQELAETQYIDNSLIPELTDNTEWENASSGALRAYEDNWGYACVTRPDYTTTTTTTI